MAGLWLILKELNRRLKAYWSQPAHRGGEELVLGVASSLPTHELFFEIDAHFLRRKKHKELEVGGRWGYFVSGSFSYISLG